MASTDWTDLTDSLSTSDVRRGVTGGGGLANGGGTFCYVMRTLTLVTGAVAKFTNQANFAPTPPNKGMSVRGAIVRGVSGGAPGFQPFLFAGCQNNTIIHPAYLLGLADGEESRIVLVKGRVLDGIPDVAPGTNGVLRRSADAVPLNEWVHLRLDMRVNANGDTVLSVFRSDLDDNPVTAPVWAPVPGLEQIIDDVSGANTGSLPFTSGRMGFGARFSDVNRRVYFDHLECFREL